MQAFQRLVQTQKWWWWTNSQSRELWQEVQSANIDIYKLKTLNSVNSWTYFSNLRWVKMILKKKLPNMYKHLKQTTMKQSRNWKFRMKERKTNSESIKLKKLTIIQRRMNWRVYLLIVSRKLEKILWREDWKMKYITKRSSNK